MDDSLLFAKNEKELETLIQAVRIYSQDTRMEFAIEKCAMQIMKSGKRHRTEGIELPNQDKIRILGKKKTYKYLGILGSDIIKNAEIKEKKTTRNQTTLQKSHQRDKYRAVLLVRYLGALLKLTRGELQQMNQRKRKLMTMHKVLHPRDDIDRLCAKTEEEELLAFKIESMQQKITLKKKREERLVTATRNNTDNTNIDKTKITRKKNGKKNN